MLVDGNRPAAVIKALPQLDADRVRLAAAGSSAAGPPADEAGLFAISQGFGRGISHDIDASQPGRWQERGEVFGRQRDNRPASARRQYRDYGAAMDWLRRYERFWSRGRKLN